MLFTVTLHLPITIFLEKRGTLQMKLFYVGCVNYFHCKGILNSMELNTKQCFNRVLIQAWTVCEINLIPGLGIIALPFFSFLHITLPDWLLLIINCSPTILSKWNAILILLPRMVSYSKVAFYYIELTWIFKFLFASTLYYMFLVVYFTPLVTIIYSI